MSTIHDVRILLPQDRDALVAFSKSRLHANALGSAMEIEMQSWSARWRTEALDHYLPQGWSFAVTSSGGQIQGYLLAQPILFFRGLTQTLWVEHVEFETAEIGRQLFDTATRWARDKHLQCVVVENSVENVESLREFPNQSVIEDKWIELRTARFQK